MTDNRQLLWLLAVGCCMSTIARAQPADVPGTAGSATLSNAERLWLYLGAGLGPVFASDTLLFFPPEILTHLRIPDRTKPS